MIRGRAASLGSTYEVAQPVYAADRMQLVGLNIRPHRIYKPGLNVNCYSAPQDDPEAADPDRWVLAALACGMGLGKLSRPGALAG